MFKLIRATFLGLIAMAFALSAYADITFVSWGGAYTASQQKAYVDTWSKGSGVTVENYNGGLGEIKAQVEAGNVTWDVVDVLPDQAITGCDEGLFEKLDQSAFINDLGFTESGLDRVIRAGYSLLGLQTFFTAGPKEARAWTIKSGMTASNAAGVIHTDFEHGFIRAETIAYDDYIALGREQGARDAGRLRLEGRDYVVNDGDIMHFRFNV